MYTCTYIHIYSSKRPGNHVGNLVSLSSNTSTGTLWNCTMSTINSISKLTKSKMINFNSHVTKFQVQFRNWNWFMNNSNSIPELTPSQIYAIIMSISWFADCRTLINVTFSICWACFSSCWIIMLLPLYYMLSRTVYFRVWWSHIIMQPCKSMQRSGQGTRTCTGNGKCFILHIPCQAPH